jgi:hypothetical protein
MAKSKKSKEVKSDWDVSDEIQSALLSHVTEEFSVAKQNNEKITEDFNAYYDMLHGVRESKPNDWESDIFLPEFESRLLTQVGSFCAQYFGSTDYVDTAMESEDPKDVSEAKASKRLLNKLLNDKEAYYYYKIVRNIMYVFTCGHGIIKGGYQQRIAEEISHYNQESEYITDPLTGDYLAEDGQPYVDPTIQKPAFQSVQKPVMRDKVLIDRPIFDVYPIQNVYVSPEYCYSLNDKEYVIFETEKTLDALKDEKDEMGYFNLNLLEKQEPEGQRGEKTYDKDGKLVQQPRPPMKTFVVMERWGKYPVIEKDGNFVPGFDPDGSFSEDATNEECIIHYVKQREKDEPEHIIGFRKSRHSKRPMVRFLCYVDMIKDSGFGDGEVNRELQKAINDNYNLMNYRTRLAITPAFKRKRFSGVDENVKISPEKAIDVENMDDLVEFQIQDNIQGGVVHNNLLSSRMDYCMATSPQTMGASPERAETATVGSIMNQRANVRIGMKSMNLEFIGFTEFYDMLLTLCNDFMLPETLEELIGKEDAMAYNPKRKDKFRPTSQALETEESKQFKIKSWQGILGMVAGIQNPKSAMVQNYILGQILELMGSSFKVFKKFMLEEDPTTMLLYTLATGGKGQGTPPAAPSAGMPPQNQQGNPQRPPEQQARQQAPQQQMGG